MSASLQLVMPMAGRGSRFYEKGFNVPKPLIVINGRPFFYWAVRSINKYIDCAGITFVVLEEHVQNFSLDVEIKKYFPESEIVSLPDVTEGAAVTCLRGIEGIKAQNPVLFNDCDHLFRCSAFNSFCSSTEQFSPDGALLTFDSDSPAYSYLEYGECGKVIRTVEKQVVSHDAICGAYYFRSGELFQSACEDYFKNCEYKEYFLSGVYNAMIKKGWNVCGFRTDFHLPFGIPEEYEAAEKSENHWMFDELL
ncbi:MAG: glycosyltransferase family 2 protein [Eubacteriales bacterium]|nr:glycosyltransferase family 2 protein [Eubacteriales bacterium]